MDSRCVNRVATGASVGGALGASIGACASNGMHAAIVMTRDMLAAMPMHFRRLCGRIWRSVVPAGKEPTLVSRLRTSDYCALQEHFMVHTRLSDTRCAPFPPPNSTLHPHPPCASCT